MEKFLVTIIFLIFSNLILDASQSESYLAFANGYQTTNQAYSGPKTDAKHKTSASSSSKRTTYHPKKVTSKASGTRKVNSKTNASVKRDKNGKIARSESATRQFKKQTGFPKGRAGYVIDHIVPLKKGGCDCPANMQWQTVEAAKAKDKWE